MGIMHRSKSAGVTGKRPPKKTVDMSLPGAISVSDNDQKRSTSYERPTTSSSFSRPRTANAAIYRSVDLQHPSFMIDIKAGDEIFSFPTPSPRLQPPKSATLKITPSPLHDPLPSPSIGVAIGSPSHARPGWGRSVTADHVSPRMPAQPPPSRPPPAVPNHPDLELPLTDVKRRKPSWKKVSMFFGRRVAKPVYEEPYYRLKMPNAIEERDISSPPIPDLAELPERGSTPRDPPPMLRLPQRSPSLTRGQARLEARADADKAALKLGIPTQKPLRSPSVVQKESFSPMFRTINGIPEDDAWVDDPRKDSPLSLMSTKSFSREPPPPPVSIIVEAPQLDLDLPDPRFERYSVMFEKLLEDSRPSLLERRQSRLNRTRSIKKLDLGCAEVDDPKLPRLEVNGVPQITVLPSPGLAKSLSVRIGKKVLSPVAEVFTALNRPRPIRRSKTAPASASSPLAKASPMGFMEVHSASPSSCPTEFSLPPTPMTVTTFSDSGSVEHLPNDQAFAQQKAEPSWDMLTSDPADEQLKPPPLRITPSAERIVHVSVAREVNVRKSAESTRGPSFECKQAMRPRMVELGKNRTSTAVLIEIAEE